MALRRILLILVALLVALPAYAEDIMGIGDSIAYGTPRSTGPWPEYATLRGLSETTYNAGVGGDSAAQVDTRIDALLESVNPSTTVVIVGSNDVRWLGTSLSAYLTSIASINTKIVNSGSASIICQITPVENNGGIFGQNETGQQNTKLWNAALEDWCYTNNVLMSPNYQELAYNDPDYEDDLYYHSPYDGVHVSSAGYTVMANLIHHAAVPIKKRVYGSTSFPTMCYNSWDWFILSAGASITGDADTGTLSLTSATADGPVECLPSGSKTITITGNATGTVAYYYRSAAATNFDRDAETAWTLYSGSFTSTDQFFQVRASGTGDVTDMTLDWTGVLPDSRTITNGAYRNGVVR